MVSVNEKKNRGGEVGRIRNPSNNIRNASLQNTTYSHHLGI